MKSCGYCGRENQGNATRCYECGSDDLVESAPQARAEVAKAAADAPIELRRCNDGADVQRLTRILDAAGIAYRCSALPSMFDVGKVGSSGDAAVIITVDRACYEAARAAMEAEDIKSEIPEGHYLLTSSDEELVEIVAHASEWSAFDVAHARRLIAKKGIDLKKVDEKKAERLRFLREGRRASRKLVFFGWVFSILGGLIGFGIGWSLAYMKEKTPEGEFFSYDEESRATGAKMLKVAAIVFAVFVILRLASAFSR